MNQVKETSGSITHAQNGNQEHEKKPKISKRSAYSVQTESATALKTQYLPGSRC
jgi:hypothetical protein